MSGQFTGSMAGAWEPIPKGRAEAERKLNSRLYVAVERYFRSSLVMSKTNKPVNSIAPKHNLLVLLVPRLRYWFTDCAS
ncbi:hypothetical protein [Microcoleus sp. S13_B4]|uniref:hypothetical protein n=1 Tax=Microcoleus sp. S13_B4 TaxID=3055408 RepID=UPI002FD0989B